MIPDNIYQAIINYLAHEATAEETILLENWLKQDINHKKLYEDYRRLWEQAQQLYRLPEPDLKTCLQQFQSNCYTRKSKSGNLFRYAAILLFPILLAIFVYYFAPSAKEPLPGTLLARNQNEVQLFLANGQKVILSDKNDKDILKTQGIRIDCNAHTLNYAHTPDTPISSVIEYNILNIPRGAEYTLVLSDGTKVYLNSESELKYPVRFAGQERKIYLKGEAYFDVSPDSLKPFIVSVRQIDIEVLGTAFNIMAYEEMSQIETTLERGYVKVKSSDTHLILCPGMQAIYRKNDASLTAKKVNTRLYTSWKDAEIMFENLRMEELLQNLSRWYDFNVFYLNPQLKDIRLTGHISKHDHIGSILELLETMGKVKFHIQNRTITVSERNF